MVNQIPKRGFIWRLFQDTLPGMQPIELLVHFDDADPAGIIFFGNYYRLHHRAMELTLPQWGLSWEDFFRVPGLGFPVRHSEADYLKPLRPGKKIYLRVVPEKIGTTSVTFLSEFRDLPDLSAPVTAVVKVTHVCIDVKTLKKHPLPEPLAEKMRVLAK